MGQFNLGGRLTTTSLACSGKHGVCHSARGSWLSDLLTPGMFVLFRNCICFDYSGEELRSGGCSLGLNGLEESLQVGGLVVEELDLIGSLLLLTFTSLIVSLGDGFDLALKLNHFVRLLLLFGLKLLDFLLKVGLTVLGLQLFAHGKCHRTLVESLVGGNSHFDFITDTEEEKSALWQIQSDLTDDLIETLGEELLTDWANTTLTSLSLHKFLVEHLSKSGYINSGSWLMTNILNVMLSLFNPFSSWQNGIQDVLLLWLVLKWRQCTSSLG